MTQVSRPSRRAVVDPALTTASTLLGMPSSARAAQPAVARPVQIALPQPSGGHPIGSTMLHLVDLRRMDPWHIGRRREVMVTVTYPAWETGAHDRAAWMPDGVAAIVKRYMQLPAGSVAWRETERHASASAPMDRRDGRRPVVLFSPGFMVPREMNTVLTDDLASHGYVVVSISHTYEAMAVEFPGGRVERAVVTVPDTTTLKTAIQARVADTRFVLDLLAVLNAGVNPDSGKRPLPQGLRGALDLSRVGVLGHSLGGFTAGEAMYRDRRIGAGVNLDGMMGYGPLGGSPYLPGRVVQHGLDRPFALVGSMVVDATGARSEHNHLPDNIDRTWVDFWPRQRGWKRDLTLLRAGHDSFTDLQAVLPQVGTLITEPNREGHIGTIEPARSLAAQHAYLAAFFDLHLRRRDDHLLDGPSPTYPEIKFVL